MHAKQLCLTYKQCPGLEPTQYHNSSNSLPFLVSMHLWIFRFQDESHGSNSEKRMVQTSEAALLWWAIYCLCSYRRSWCVGTSGNFRELFMSSPAFGEFKVTSPAESPICSGQVKALTELWKEQLSQLIPLIPDKVLPNSFAKSFSMNRLSIPWSPNSRRQERMSRQARTWSSQRACSPRNISHVHCLRNCDKPRVKSCQIFLSEWVLSLFLGQCPCHNSVCKRVCKRVHVRVGVSVLVWLHEWENISSDSDKLLVSKVSKASDPRDPWRPLKCQ